MSRISPFALGLALPVTLFSQAAFADLTPTDVWGDWRSYMEGMGYQVTATEQSNGGTLSVSDIAMCFPMPDTEGEMTMSIDAVDFIQNSDGTVAIVLPETLPISVTGQGGPTGTQDMSLTMNYTQSGHAMTASGSPEALTYLMTAQTFGIELVEMKVDNVALGPDDARISMSGNNMSTTTNLTRGDIRGYEQNGSIDNVAYDFFFKSPDGEDAQGAIKGSIGGITMSGTGSIPSSVKPGADIAQMLAAGFDVVGAFDYTQGASTFDIKDPENGNYVMNTTSSGGTLGVKMGVGGLAYDVAQRDLNVAVQVEAMPFPFELAMAQSAFNLAMPISKSDEVQDFAFGITMGDFTMSDIIWGMFDPSGQLPRDPATIILDLTGKAKLLVDWMNPEAAAQMTGAPGEVKQLTLGNLLVSAAGAQVNGTGDIAFDGAPSGLVPGAGNPVGDVNIAVAGGNGLLDKLVNMGLLPQEQAMGARMMMGLFAVPGDAPDTLKSKIEFTQDGQILANGQRIR